MLKMKVPDRCGSSERNAHTNCCCWSDDIVYLWMRIIIAWNTKKVTIRWKVQSDPINVFNGIAKQSVDDNKLWLNRKIKSIQKNKLTDFDFEEYNLEYQIAFVWCVSKEIQTVIDTIKLWGNYKHDGKVIKLTKLHIVYHICI